MNRITLLALIFSFYWFADTVNAQIPVSLNQYVENGKVDYEQIGSSSEFANFITSLADVNPGSLSDQDQKRFWVNAYNSLLIQGVYSSLPLETIQEVHGGGLLFMRFFSRDFFADSKTTIAGEVLSLNDIKNKKLASFNDPRLPFVLLHPVNSGFPLDRFLFDSNRFDETLDEYTSLFMSDTRYTILDAYGRSVFLPGHLSHFSNLLPRGKSALVGFMVDYMDQSYREIIVPSPRQGEPGLILSEDILRYGPRWTITYRPVSWKLNSL